MVKAVIKQAQIHYNAGTIIWAKNNAAISDMRGFKRSSKIIFVIEQ